MAGQEEKCVKAPFTKESFPFSPSQASVLTVALDGWSVSSQAAFPPTMMFPQDPVPLHEALS